MSDELRDRIAEIIDARMAEWLGIKTELNINEYAAQAIIDEFGLHAYEFTPHNGPTRTYVHGAIKENDQ